MALTLANITELFLAQGAVQYGSEAVSQQQHALQCALLAERAGASSELIAAALLHDLGHLVSPAAVHDKPGVDDLHQYLALPFLRGVFSDAVLEPIRLHVDAKRYLCQADPHYYAALSPSSQRSLVLQGGPFTGEEAADFLLKPFATDAAALRRWDDMAKDPLATTPDWAHYVAVLESSLLSSA